MTNEKNKIDIPEQEQNICREIGAIAAKHGLISFSGTFMPRGSWGGEISFKWEAGRHSEDSNDIQIFSKFSVSTKIKQDS